MTTTFTPGLSPHNYVEFQSNSKDMGVSRQPQRMVLMQKGAKDEFHANILKESPLFAYATKAKEICSGLEVCGLFYTSDLSSALKLLPEEQFTQLVLLGDDETELIEAHDFLTHRWESSSLSNKFFRIVS